MSLSTALHVASSALMVNAAQADIASRNIANADRADYARRSAALITFGDNGGVGLTVERATSRALAAAKLIASSSDAAAAAVRDGLTQLAQAGGLTSVDGVTSSALATGLADLNTAIAAAASDPNSATLRGAVIDSARSLTQTFHDTTAAIQTARADADANIAAAVGEVNDLLTQFKQANDDVVRGATRGGDINDALDRRDGIVAALSAKIGVQSLMRANGDMALYTDSGVTLFDKSPRAVSFAPTSTFDASTSGGNVFVDGVPLANVSGQRATSSGEIFGLMRVRDEFAPRLQAQLDEMARGLTQAFVERDPSGVASDALGLFTDAGGTNPLAVGGAAGLAGRIVVAASVDPRQGGDTQLLRDGGVAGVAYRLNAAGASGYDARLLALNEALRATQAFDPAAEAGASATVESYVANSVSWLEGARRSADQSATQRATVLAHVSTSLSNATGVNLDDEMSKLLVVENSYRATTKLISTVDAMLQSLLQAVG